MREGALSPSTVAPALDGGVAETTSFESAVADSGTVEAEVGVGPPPMRLWEDLRREWQRVQVESAALRHEQERWAEWRAAQEDHVADVEAQLIAATERLHEDRRRLAQQQTDWSGWKLRQEAALATALEKLNASARELDRRAAQPKKERPQISKRRKERVAKADSVGSSFESSTPPSSSQFIGPPPPTAAAPEEIRSLRRAVRQLQGSLNDKRKEIVAVKTAERQLRTQVIALEAALTRRRDPLHLTPGRRRGARPSSLAARAAVSRSRRPRLGGRHRDESREGTSEDSSLSPLGAGFQEMPETEERITPPGGMEEEEYDEEHTTWSRRKTRRSTPPAGDASSGSPTLRVRHVESAANNVLQIQWEGRAGRVPYRPLAASIGGGQTRGEGDTSHRSPAVPGSAVVRPVEETALPLDALRRAKRQRVSPAAPSPAAQRLGLVQPNANAALPSQRSAAPSAYLGDRGEDRAFLLHGLHPVSRRSRSVDAPVGGNLRSSLAKRGADLGLRYPQRDQTGMAAGLPSSGPWTEGVSTFVPLTRPPGPVPPPSGTLGIVEPHEISSNTTSSETLHPPIEAPPIAATVAMPSRRASDLIAQLRGDVAAAYRSGIPGTQPTSPLLPSPITAPTFPIAQFALGPPRFPRGATQTPVTPGIVVPPNRPASDQEAVRIGASHKNTDAERRLQSVEARLRVGRAGSAGALQTGRTPPFFPSARKAV